MDLQCLDKLEQLAENLSMHAVGYVRTLPGAPEHTLYAQREKLRVWAKTSGIALAAVFQDESNGDNRPGLRTLWAGLSEFDAVIVESLDVLSGNLITQELMVQRLEDLGVATVVADQSADPAGEAPNRVALREIVRNVVSAQSTLDEMVESRNTIDRAPLFLEIVPEEGADDEIDSESAV